MQHIFVFVFRARKLKEVQKYEKLPPHPHCVRFYMAWVEKNVLYIQTELCKATLAHFAETYPPTEEVLWEYLLDLCLVRLLFLRLYCSVRFF